MPSSARDDGLSEVVGFVLLLAVIVVALSLYQVYGVPAVGRENEIAHMNQVKDRFVDYKIALDSLWVNNRHGVLLSTAFDLGTGAPATAGSAFSLPILNPAGSGGTVSVKSGGASLTIEPEGGSPVTIPLGNLTYRSSNNYWVDQTWTYQMGAVFLSQEGGTTVRVGPSIAVAKTRDDNISLTVAPIRIEGSDMIAGSGPMRIETRMRLSNTSSVDGVYDRVNLTIEANDADDVAWKRAFDEVRQRAKDENVTSLPTPELFDGNKSVRLTIKPEADDKKVFLSVYPANYTVTIHNAASLVE
ncbi:hypothetical protein HL657_13155 [Methanoculleus sp. YWC-01]|uniref:Flagellin n=1 Tax=Methanoculleus nereidis TaxID=2735141 RepID=A0ABU3Z657_9EURY|nr:hypothetical protein [Methanoculleus sp. YWC-01]MDV4344095.1 hypothetical protein [Methanoculleus sp. YWC-01]